MKTPRKKSSYQSMKERYEKKISDLTSDILTLVSEDEKDFIEQEGVKLKWRFKLTMGVENPVKPMISSARIKQIGELVTKQIYEGFSNK